MIGYCKGPQIYKKRKVENILFAGSTEMLRSVQHKNNITVNSETLRAQRPFVNVAITFLRQKTPKPSVDQTGSVKTRIKKLYPY